MDPVSDSTPIDLCIHMLLAGDFDKDQERVVLAIADFCGEAHAVEAFDECFEPFLSFRLICKAVSINNILE